MEITLFNTKGRPKAYISLEDDKAIYTWNGKAVSYIDEDKVYGWRGKHIGWFVNNILFDLNGYRVGYTKETCPHITHIELLKNIKFVKYVKYAKSTSYSKPSFSNRESEIDLIDFVSQNKI